MAQSHQYISTRYWLKGASDVNFLGLNLNENMSWKSHIDVIANKITKFSGCWIDWNDIYQETSQ